MILIITYPHRMNNGVIPQKKVNIQSTTKRESIAFNDWQKHLTAESILIRKKNMTRSELWSSNKLKTA